MRSDGTESQMLLLVLIIRIHTICTDAVGSGARGAVDIASCAICASLGNIVVALVFIGTGTPVIATPCIAAIPVAASPMTTDAITSTLATCHLAEQLLGRRARAIVGLAGDRGADRREAGAGGRPQASDLDG